MFSLRKKITKEFAVPYDMSTAAVCYLQALQNIGQARIKTTADPAEKLITGKSFYGLQTVPVQILLKEKGMEETSVNISARADDFRGIGAEKCITRLLEAADVYRLGDSNSIIELEKRSPLLQKIGITKRELFVSVLLVAVLASAISLFIMGYIHWTKI